MRRSGFGRQFIEKEHVICENRRAIPTTIDTASTNDSRLVCML